MIAINTIINIAVALLLFGFIVLFHEFGHYIAARLCGVRVLEFAIGMGPRLIGVKKRGTIYSLRALPIGGFCSMLGEDEEDDAETADTHEAETEPSENAGTEPDGSRASGGVSLNEVSSWRRLLIVLAGPAFNFILAFFFALLIASAVGRDSCQLMAVTEGYPADQAGIKAGDTITAINGKKIVFFRELTQYLYFHPREEMVVTVSRGQGADANSLSFAVTPKYSETQGGFLIGVQVRGGRTRVQGLPARFYYAGQEVRFHLTSTVEALVMMARGALSPDSLTGPVGIVESIGETVNESKQFGLWAVFLNLVNMGVLLSANLGVMNLLPLPALDGGRMVFCLLELLFRRRINKRVEGYVHLSGFVLLMGLMIFVLFHDLERIFH